MKQDRSNTHLSIALQYDGKNAPKVTASARDEIALLMKRLAKEHDIPIYYEPVLAQILSSMDEGEEIPENLYRAVAEVIAFAYMLAGKVCALPTDDDQQ